MDGSEGAEGADPKHGADGEEIGFPECSSQFESKLPVSNELERKSQTCQSRKQVLRSEIVVPDRNAPEIIDRKRDQHPKPGQECKPTRP